MSTTSVYPDYFHPQQFPPPLNPTGYTAQPSEGINITHLHGTFDPAAIPVPPPNTRPVTYLGVQPPTGFDFATVIKILIQNQTALQQQFLANQTSLQQNLLNVMHKVAHHPNIVAATEPAIPTPRGNSIKLYPSLIKNADNCLDTLKQSGSAHSYLTALMEIAAHLNMTEETKISRFMKGLKPAVKDGLVPIVDRPKTLEAWEPIIIFIDNNLHQRRIEHDTAMDVDTITTVSSAPRGPLSKTKREHRFKNNLCLYCGDAGHKVTDCLKRKHVNEQGKGLKSKTV
ncbi:hypothetical protein C0991_001122 [Blastosporella zonata]|nr:hypothetical protein C0991_001122 [Blastosporella zonata]